jgi:hypothetical protein
MVNIKVWTCLTLAAMTGATLTPAKGQSLAAPALGGAPCEAQPSGFSDYGPQHRDFLFTDIQVPRVDYLGFEDIETGLVGSRLFIAHDQRYQGERMYQS